MRSGKDADAFDAMSQPRHRGQSPFV